MQALALLVGASLLGGCASINVQALKPDGSAAVGAAGLRYYMPRPYLLVTEIPFAVPTQTAGAAKTPGKKGSAKADDSAQDQDGSGSGDQPITAASSGTDASYQHALNGYQVKLIYLPDMTRPMAITVSAGFGSVGLEPTLVDGWMLTSMKGNADSKVNEVLTAVASIITAQKTPSAATSAAAAAGSTDTKAFTAKPTRPLLLPGLYAFEYDAVGQLDKICAVTLFGGPVAGDAPAGSIGLCDRK